MELQTHQGLKRGRSPSVANVAQSPKRGATLSAVADMKVASLSVGSSLPLVYEDGLHIGSVIKVTDCFVYAVFPKSEEPTREWKYRKTALARDYLAGDLKIK